MNGCWRCLHRTLLLQTSYLSWSVSVPGGWFGFGDPPPPPPVSVYRSSEFSLGCAALLSCVCVNVLCCHRTALFSCTHSRQQQCVCASWRHRQPAASCGVKVSLSGGRGAVKLRSQTLRGDGLHEEGQPHTDSTLGSIRPPLVHTVAIPQLWQTVRNEVSYFKLFFS